MILHAFLNASKNRRNCDQTLCEPICEHPCNNYCTILKERNTFRLGSVCFNVAYCALPMRKVNGDDQHEYCRNQEIT